MSVHSDLPLGQVIYTAVKPIFKIYLIMAVGFYLARKNILTVDTSRNISSIALNVLIPSISFQKIVTNINNTMIKEIATIVIVGFFMMFSQALIIFGVGVAAGCPRNWWGGLILCGLLPNISDLPIAYLQTMETAGIFANVDLGVSFVMIYLCLQMIIQFPAGSYRLVEWDFKTERLMQQKSDKEKGADGANDIGDLEQCVNIDGDSVNYNIGNNENNQNNDNDNDDNNDNHNVNDADQGHNKSSHSSLSKELHQIPGSNNIPNVIVGATDSSTMLSSIDSESLNSNASRLTPRSSNFHELAHQASIVRKTTQNSGNDLRRNISHISNISMLQNDKIDQPPEDLNDIVRVYSKYNNSAVAPDVPTPQTSKTIQSELKKSINLKKIGKNEQKFQHKFISSIKKIDWKSTIKETLYIILDSLKMPASFVLIISIVICMIPWVQALFVNSPQVKLPPAPDKQPPLSFIMDFAGYIANAQVPFGLLLLGGTIGRLKIETFPKKYWKVPVSIMFMRLFIFPVIGCAFNSKIHKDGLFYGQDILYFLSNINFCLPPATSLLYLTAFYTPIDGKYHVQMDLLSLVYISHYIFLVVCLPFTATYTMKVSLDY